MSILLLIVILVLMGIIPFRLIKSWIILTFILICIILIISGLLWIIISAIMVFVGIIYADLNAISMGFLTLAIDVVCLYVFFKILNWLIKKMLSKK